MQARGAALVKACRAVLPSAVVVWAIAELPVLLHGAARFWGWAVLAAMLGGAAAAARPPWRRQAPAQAWRTWWPCALAVGAGVTADFFVLPPAIMLSICRGTGGFDFDLAAVLAHVRLLPATSAAMLLVIGFIQWRAHAHRRIQGAWVRALPAIALEFAAMLTAMAFCVELLRATAAGANLPWTGDGMGVGMVAGMLLSAALTRAGAAGTSRLKGKWLHG